MALSFTNLLAELENVVAEAQKAAPAIEALLTVAEKVKPLLPAADQALVTNAEAALTALVSVLSKV
jgi:hypothetical protein